MSEDALPAWRDDAQELQDLRQFFYQCPVGLFEIDDDGLVLKVNPAAVAMLAPAIGRSNLAKLFPILDRLAPDLIGIISQDRDRVGPLAAGERILVPAEIHGASSLEIRAVRVAAGRVMVVLVDVSAERRLAGADAQHWCEALLAGLTDGQLISDDVVVACLYLRGGHNEVPRP